VNGQINLLQGIRCHKRANRLTGGGRNNPAKERYLFTFDSFSSRLNVNQFYLHYRNNTAATPTETLRNIRQQTLYKESLQGSWMALSPASSRKTSLHFPEKSIFQTEHFPPF